MSNGVAVSIYRAAEITGALCRPKSHIKLHISVPGSLLWFQCLPSTAGFVALLQWDWLVEGRAQHVAC